MSAPQELMTTNQTSDRVFLRELAVECVIGFLDWERLVKQTVYLDIEVPVDCRRAALTDDVAQTLDYKRLSKVVLAFVGASEFKLVETLADRTAKLILTEFDIPWVKLTINKRGAIRASRDVGVMIERTRADLA
jgi:7,8-dihydroneopterin aldolase/epimerase/oxygenase